MDITKKDFIQSLTDSIVAKGAGGRLTPRDYEILRFILEQKFCSLEAIYFRFFDVRKSPADTMPKNLWTTRQRLSKLRGIALIKTEKVLSTGKAHFLITPYGHKVLTTHVEAAIAIRPARTIDFSLFEHDVRITMIRALTESKGRCQAWYSEKWLKACPIKIDGKYKFHFAKDLRPDAFFINSKGEKMALELEVSRKARSRIEEKIRQYDDLLSENYRASQERFKVLDKVWFITTKPAVARFLLKMIEKTSRHKLCYRVDFYDEIVPEAARG
jgi:5-hydroxyisourate hydrolase-like protein (transthyretin family)